MEWDENTTQLLSKEFVNQFPSNEDEILFLLKLKIVGNAACHMKYANIRSFAELHFLLISQYISVDAIAFAYENISQNSTETVKEYGSRLSKYFHDYIKYLNLSHSHLLEKRAKRKFRIGLRNRELQRKTLQ